MLIILAIGLMVVLSIYSAGNKMMKVTGSSIQSSKARIAVDRIANAADQLYQQGVGSKTKVLVSIPSDTLHFSVVNRTILLQMQVGGSISEIYRTVNYNFSGEFPSEDGNHWIYLESREGWIDASQNASVESILPSSENTTVFYDGFEAWTSSDCGDGGLWDSCFPGDGNIKRNNDGFAGDKAVRFVDHDLDDDYLIKCVDLSDYSSAYVVFWWKKSDLDGGEYGKLEAKSQYSGYSVIFDSGIGSSHYAEEVIDITSYISPDTCLKFHALADIGSDRFDIDEFTIFGAS